MEGTHHRRGQVCGVGGLQIVQVPVAPQVLEGQGMHQAHDVQQRLLELYGALQAGALPAAVKDNCLQVT